MNHPPTAPVLAANPRPLDAADVTLRWSAAMDLDGEQPTYELRIDSDGEVLESYAQQIFPGQGVTSLAVTAPLAPGVTYTFAVRARDPHGALSPWSAPETFTVATAGTVTVNGTPAANLRSAVAGAQAGDLIVLGAGTYPLSDTLHVAGGVSVRGAGAGRTTIDATGLAVGVSFGGTDPKSPTVLDKATVTGAATCVAVGSGATGVAADAPRGARLRDGGNHGGGRRWRGDRERDGGDERDRGRRDGDRDDQEQPGDRQRRRPRRARGRAIWPAATTICSATRSTTRGWWREPVTWRRR